MRLNLLKFYLLSFSILCISTTRAQDDDAKYLKNYDEKHAVEAAKKEGLSPEETLAFIKRYRKHHIEVEKAKEQHHQLNPFDASALNSSKVQPNHQVMNNPYCPNAGFDQNNFGGWTGGWFDENSGSAWTSSPWLSSSNWTSGAFATAPNNSSLSTSNAQHTIMTTPPGNNNPSLGPIVGYDVNSINPSTGLAEVPVVAPTGGGSSVRLGNGDGLAETARLTYTVNVTPQNTQFTYQYAVFLNNNGHPVADQPFFKITVRDTVTGQLLGGSCGQYQIDASASQSVLTQQGYVTSQATFGGAVIYYKNWTSVTVDLSGSINSVVTIEFQVADCSQEGHFGYAYIDADCGALQGTAAGFCAGSTNAQLQAPGGFVSYQWYGPNNASTVIPGATSSTLNIAGPVQGDVYTVLMQSAAGCYTSLAITMNQSILTAAFTPTNTCLGGSFGSVTANPSGGLTGSYIYNWYTGPNQTGTNVGTTQTVNNLGPGTYYLHLNSGTCGAFDTSVTISNIPPVPTSTSVLYCGAQANLTSAAGNSAYQWWDTSGAVISGATGQNYTATNPVNNSIYTVSYQNTTSGCRDSVQVTLVSNYPTFNPLVTPPCGGGNNGNIQFTTGGGNYAPYSYTYTSSVPSTGNGSGLQLSNLSDGTYTVTLYSTANPSCAVTDTVDVNQNVIPVNYDTAYVCNYAITQVGPPPSLGTPGPTFHHWNYLNQTSQNINLPVPSTNHQTFIDTITYSANCKTVYRVTVKHKELNITLGPTEVNHCYNDSTGSINVSIVPNTAQAGYAGTPPFNYVWTGTYFHPHNSVSSYTSATTGTTSSNDLIANLYSGTYSVTVTTADGCRHDTSFAVTEPPKPQPILDIQDWYCHRDTAGFLVAPLGNMNYQWYQVTNGGQDTTLLSWNDDTLYIANPEATATTYFVTYIYFLNGCRMVTNAHTPMTPPPPFEPDMTVNIFSPNGDNRNDKFMPFFHPTITQVGINYYADEFNMKIYDRWGKFVYETSDYLQGWDGKRNGVAVDDGNYFWIAKYKPRCGNGYSIEKQGFVQVVH